MSSTGGPEQGIQTKKGETPGCLCPESEGRFPLSGGNGRRPKGAGPAVRREQAKREDNKRSQTTTLCTRCPPHIEADGSSRRSNDEATELPRAARMDRSDGRKPMKGILPGCLRPEQREAARSEPARRDKAPAQWEPASTTPTNNLNRRKSKCRKRSSAKRSA